MDSSADFGEPNIPQTVKTLFRDMDENLYLKKSITDLPGWKSEEAIFMSNLSTHVEANFSNWRQIIGEKPSKFVGDFDAVDMCGSVSKIAGRLENLDINIEDKLRSLINYDKSIRSLLEATNQNKLDRSRWSSNLGRSKWNLPGLLGKES